MATKAELKKRFEQARKRNDYRAMRALLGEGKEALALFSLAQVCGMTPDDEKGEKALVELIEALLDAGVDPNAHKSSPMPPLHALINNPRLQAGTRRKLVERLLDVGADPAKKDASQGWDAIGWCIQGRRRELFDFFLSRGPTEEQLLGGLATAVATAANFPAAARAEKTYPYVQAMLERIADPSRPGGKPPMPAVHRAVQTGDLPVLGFVIAKGGAELGLPEPITIQVGELTPPGGGPIPSLELAAGTTPLRMVEAILEPLLERHRVHDRKEPPFLAAKREERIAFLSAARELLGGAEAKTQIADPRANAQPAKTEPAGKTRPAKKKKTKDASTPALAPIFAIVEGCPHRGARAVLDTYDAKKLLCGWCGERATRVELTGHEPARLGALHTWFTWDGLERSGQHHRDDARALERLGKSAASLSVGDHVVPASLWSAELERPGGDAKAPAASEADESALFAEVLRADDPFALLEAAARHSDEARAFAAVRLLGRSRAAKPNRARFDPGASPDAAKADELEQAAELEKKDGRTRFVTHCDPEREIRVKRILIGAATDPRRASSDEAIAWLGASDFDASLRRVWLWLSEEDRAAARGAALDSLRRLVSEAEAGGEWTAGPTFGHAREPFVICLAGLFAGAGCAEPQEAFALVDRLRALERADDPSTPRSFALAKAVARKTPGDAAVPWLAGWIESSDDEAVRAQAMEVLARLRHPDAVRALIAQLDSPDGEHAQRALASTGMLEGGLEDALWTQVREAKLASAGPLEALDADAWRETMGDEAEELDVAAFWSLVQSDDLDPLRMAAARTRMPAHVPELAWSLWARTGELLDCARPLSDHEAELARLRAAIETTKPTPRGPRVDVTVPYAGSRAAARPDEEQDASGRRWKAPSLPHVGFHRTTYALLVAGRASAGNLTWAQAAALAEWASARGLVCVPAGDLSPSPGLKSPDDRVHDVLVLGKPVLCVGADEGPSKGVSLDELRAAVAEGASLLEQHAGELAAHGVAFDEDVALHALCAGPLAAAYVALGEPSRAKARVVRGSDMEQRPHRDGVLGIEVALVDYTGSATAVVDLSDAAHARAEARAAKAGAKDARYYVMAAYDVC